MAKTEMAKKKQGAITYKKVQPLSFPCLTLRFHDADCVVSSAFCSLMALLRSQGKIGEGWVAEQQELLLVRASAFQEAVRVELKLTRRARIARWAHNLPIKMHQNAVAEFCTALRSCLPNVHRRVWTTVCAAGHTRTHSS